MTRENDSTAPSADRAKVLAYEKIDKILAQNRRYRDLAANVREVAADNAKARWDKARELSPEFCVSRAIGDVTRKHPKTGVRKHRREVGSDAGMDGLCDGVEDGGLDQESKIDALRAAERFCAREGLDPEQLRELFERGEIAYKAGEFVRSASAKYTDTERLFAATVSHCETELQIRTGIAWDPDVARWVTGESAAPLREADLGRVRVDAEERRCVEALRASLAEAQRLLDQQPRDPETGNITTYGKAGGALCVSWALIGELRARLEQKMSSGLVIYTRWDASELRRFVWRCALHPEHFGFSSMPSAREMALVWLLAGGRPEIKPATLADGMTVADVIASQAKTIRAARKAVREHAAEYGK